MINWGEDRIAPLGRHGRHKEKPGWAPSGAHQCWRNIPCFDSVNIERFDPSAAGRLTYAFSVIDRCDPSPTRRTVISIDGVKNGDAPSPAVLVALLRERAGVAITKMQKRAV